MSEAREIDAWDHTATILATIAGFAKKRVRVEDFHPYRKRQNKVRLTGGALHTLKDHLERLKL